MLGLKSKKEKEREAFAEANRIQKDQAAENRKSGNRVIGKFKEIEVNCQGIASSNTQQLFRVLLQDYETQVERAATNAYCDVSKVDDYLQEQIHFLGEMMRGNNLEGARLATEIISDIISNRNSIGRAVDESKAKKRYEVVLDRAEKSEAVLNAFSKYNDNQENIRRTQREIETKRVNYNARLEKMEKLNAGDEATVRAFCDEKKIAGNDREAFENAMDEEYNNLVIIHESVTDLKNSLIRYQELGVNLASAINDAKFHLEEMDSTMDSETKEAIQRIMDDHVELMARINDEIVELHQMREDYHNKLLAVMDDTRIRMIHLENKRKAMKLLRQDWSVDDVISEGSKMSNETKVVQSN